MVSLYDHFYFQSVLDLSCYFVQECGFPLGLNLLVIVKPIQKVMYIITYYYGDVYRET